MTEVPPVLSAGDYLRLDRPKLAFVWDKLVPKPGTVVLGGEPFSGKSHFSLQLANHLANGTRFGPRDCIKSRVLYMMLESDELVWREILGNFEREIGPLADDLFIVHPDFPTKPPWTNIAEQRTVDWMLAMVKHCDPEVIFIDPYRDLHSLDEQTSTQMKAVTDALMYLFHGRALVILHHMKKIWTEKGQEVDPILALRGSSQIAAQASAVWLLHGPDEACKDIKVVPRWTKRETFTVKHIHPDTGFWEFVMPGRIEPSLLPSSECPVEGTGP